MTTELAERIRSFLRERVSADEFSGCVLVARKSEPILREAYGQASKRYGVLNLIDTKFNLGSCNKVFTKVAIMQLAERGKLSLGDFVSRHLSNYPAKVADRITVGQLLNHSSGMGDFWNERFYATRYRLKSVDDFINLFINDQLSFEPGSRIQYSNAGYVLLGKIIEVVSDQDYYDYMREHIYTPAGMKNSDHYEMDRPIPNLAIGYTRMDEHGNRVDGLRRENSFILGIKGSPAGGGYSTVDDMLRFCVALRDHELLGQKYTDLAYLPSVLPGTGQQTKMPSFGIAGGAPGVGATFKIYFDSNFVKVILSNYDPDCMETVSRKIDEFILRYS